LADCHHALEEAWRIYLVRSLGFQPEPSSHDWHVQPSCQRTDPLPPERAPSVQSRDTQVHPCLSSKLVQTTRLARPLSTRRDHRIFTRFPQPGRVQFLSIVTPDRLQSEESAFGSLSHTRQNASPTPHSCHFGTSRGGRPFSLKKDHLEVLANNA
jgi:hypothetical protein